MPDTATIEKPGDLIRSILEAANRAHTRPKVYPGYVAWRVKRALRSDDPERLLTDVGEIRTIGDCRYAMTVTDHNGTEYEVMVRVKP